MDQILTVDCITLLLRQPWEELLPWERTPWHWSKHVKFRPSWLFHKRLSFSAFACWTFGVLVIMGYRSGILRLEFLAFLSAIRIERKIEKNGIWYRFWDFPSLYRVLASHDRRCNESNIGGFHGCWHVGTLNSAYWAFPTFQAAFIWAIALVVLWSVHKGVPKQTCKNYLRRKQGCKLMDQISTVDCITLLLRQPWEGLVLWERTPWHWSKRIKFRPSRLVHKDYLPLHSCETATLPHVGTLNSAYWAFSTFEMHGSIAFSESSEQNVPLQIWFRSSICKL